MAEIEPIEFIDTMRHADTGSLPQHREWLSKKTKVRLAKTAAGLAAIGLATAAVASKPPKPNKTVPRAQASTSSLLASVRGVHSDPPNDFSGSHELDEMMCGYDAIGKKEVVRDSARYVGANNPLAIQLARPALYNFAIIYTGIGEDILSTQHIIFRQHGQKVHISSDTPGPVGDGDKLQTLVDITIPENRGLEGVSGTVEYGVERIGGKLTVVLACDPTGTDEQIKQAIRGAHIAEPTTLAPLENMFEEGPDALDPPVMTRY